MNISLNGKISGLLLAGVLTLLSFMGCESEKYTEITGRVKHAKQGKVVLERQGLQRHFFVDSLRLKNGEFKFKVKPELTPEFYSLSVDGQSIPFLIDSTMQLHFEIDMQDIHAYTVSGSEESMRMKETDDIMRHTMKELNRLTREGYTSSDEEWLKPYIAMKDSLGPRIFNCPRCFSSYYTVFKQFKGYPLFNPLEKKDSRYYASVASALKFAYPEHYRSVHLYEYMTLRIEERRGILLQERLKLLPPSVPEIALPNVSGDTVSLRDCLEKKHVLLVFWSYWDSKSPQLFEDLNYLYKKYRSQGLEIYQVSLDTDVEDWQKRLKGLQYNWIQVNDNMGKNSITMRAYNVQNIPWAYMISEEADIVRPENMSRTALEKVVVQVLKK